MSSAFMRRSCMAIAISESGLPRAVPGKTKSPVRISFRARENGDGSVRQWHAVLLACLHAASQE